MKESKIKMFTYLVGSALLFSTCMYDNRKNCILFYEYMLGDYANMRVSSIDTSMRNIKIYGTDIKSGKSYTFAPGQAWYVYIKRRVLEGDTFIKNRDSNEFYVKNGRKALNFSYNLSSDRALILPPTFKNLEDSE